MQAKDEIDTEIYRRILLRCRVAVALGWTAVILGLATAIASAAIIFIELRLK